jgi:hypothetical protein
MEHLLNPPSDKQFPSEGSCKKKTGCPELLDIDISPQMELNNKPYTSWVNLIWYLMKLK